MQEKDGAGSSEFRLFETDEFRKQLSKLPSLDGNRIRRKLEARIYSQLRSNPYVGPNIRKLRGYEPETWRYRVGGFRLFYQVDAGERIVFLLTIEHRRDAYR